MDNIIRFIGDTHGDFLKHFQLMKGANTVMHVGDVGIGFNKLMDDYFHKEMSQYVNELDTSFIRGNHDHPQKIKDIPGYIPDGTMKNNIFCVGGAYSIDKDWRTEGKDWWPEEELTQVEWNHILNEYEKIKPDYVMTHDCPWSVVTTLFMPTYLIPSITSQGLNAMFEIHKPKLHVFGHWHINRVEVIEGTKFVCVGNDQAMDINMDTLEVLNLYT